ncbi:MAG: hypothetical protein WBL63_16000 [Candidatus Acidiferrum sp.]
MRFVSVIKIAASLLGFVVFGVLPARAQSEIDPDHFDSPGTKPSENGKTSTGREAGSIQYNATFTLPYSAQCNGKSLARGKYSLLLRSDGKQGQVTLNRKGYAIALAGVVHQQTPNHPSDALIVEVSGKIRKLASIQLAKLDLVLEPEPRIRNTRDSKPNRIDKLLLRPIVQKSEENRIIPEAPSHQY